MTKTREEKLAYWRGYNKRNRIRINAQKKLRMATPEGKAAAQAWQEKNRERRNARRRERSAQSPELRERNRQRSAARYKSNPVLHARRTRLLRYGLTEQDFAARLAAQGGLCAICCLKSPQAIDHCHSDGRVRGLLCDDCNHALGFIHDNISSLANAIEYLKR